VASLAGTWVDPASCEVRDVDECRVANGGCLPNAHCVNRDAREAPGHVRFECQCPYFGDGVTQCETVRYTVTVMVLAQNESASDFAVNVTWLELQAGAFLRANGFNVSEITVERATTDSQRRRLLQAASGFEHFTLVFDVSDWDAMQALTSTLNAQLLAEHVTGATGGLNQVSVLQEATAAVEEAEVEFTLAQLTSPGFLIHNFTYNRVGGEYIWDIDASFYSPPGTTHVLFASKGQAGHPPENHPCTAATDLCCLVRMLETYHMGAFEAFINASIAPLCDPVSKLVRPEHATTTSASILSTAPHTDWVTDLFAHGDWSSSVTTPPSPVPPEQRMGGSIQLSVHISQDDVATSLSQVSQMPNATRYEFAVGMLFLKGLSVPEMYSAVGQTRLMVQATSSLDFVAATSQDYSILEFVDHSLIELQYWPSANTAHRLQFLRVVAVVPATVSSPHYLSASVQVAVAENVTVLAGLASPWTNPCFSGTDDGSGPWDPSAPPELRNLYNAAAAQQCAMRDIAWCTSQASALPNGDSIITFDIPLGGELLTPEALDAGQSLFVRMLIEGSKDGSSVLTQISNQVQASAGAVLRLCEPPLSSLLKDTDFVSVSLAVGVTLQPVDAGERDAIVFHDVVNAQDYQALKALDIADSYTAVSALDSVLTIALLGTYNFFNAPGHTQYTVEVDHVLMVHIRGEDKYNATRTLVQSGRAVTVSRDSQGFGTIEALPALVQTCNEAVETDCAITHPIFKRETTAGINEFPRAHALQQAPEAEIAWLLQVFGDTQPMREVATKFATDTRTQFGYNWRYRRGWWVLPTYPWPAPSIGLLDRTLSFVAFSVDRNPTP
jgi:hypothetical protein